MKTATRTGFHLVIDREILKSAKIKAIQEDLALKDVIETLLDQWAKGKVTVKPPKT